MGAWRAPLIVLAALLGFAAAPAEAEEAKPQALRLSLVYKLDVMDVVQGGAGRGARVLDNLNLFADVDLDAAVGWRGATAHVSFLGNQGGEPNRLAGALQGVDNIEVSDHRAKIYEAWIDQSMAGGAIDLRAGLYDTNSEFNVTDSSALFLAPTYGISSEISSTGPSGPSIFPSTALAVRLNLQPRKDVYVRLAAIDAQAGTLGDPQGVDTRLASGLVVFAEAGWTGSGKVAIGVWRYTDRQPDRHDRLPSGEAKLSDSHGAYLLLDHPVFSGAEGRRQTSAFLRLGLSDGDTSPYRMAGSFGVVASHILASRPDSVLGIGFSWGGLSAKYRADSAEAGAPLSATETAVEITYADKLGPHLTLQPDIQFIHRPSGEAALKDAVVVGARGVLSF